MLAMQEPYSLLASALGQLHLLDTDHAGFSGQRRLSIGNDSVEIVIRFSPARIVDGFCWRPRVWRNFRFNCQTAERICARILAARIAPEVWPNVCPPENRGRR